MRSMVLWLWIPIFTACAGTPLESKHSAPAGLQAAAAATSAPTADRRGSPFTRRDCALTRAIDGYVVCAPTIKATAPTGANRHGPALTVSLEAVPPAAQSVESAPLQHRPGQYLVIGSFSDRDNAARWAEFNAEFGTEIYAANRDQRPLYRVLVGPLDDTDSPAILREIFSSVGLPGSWHIAICGGSASRRACPDLDAAGLTRVAEI